LKPKTLQVGAIWQFQASWTPGMLTTARDSSLGIDCRVQIIFQPASQLISVIPFLQKERKKVQSKKENDIIPKMPGKKLLVADDSLTIQKVIRLSLSNEGYEIQAVSQCSEALEEIALFLPDLVLIDVSLPEQSAFEVKRIVNEDPRFAQTRFILMSSAFEQVDEHQVEMLGFHGHLTKPFDPAHLRKILLEALQQEPPPSLPEMPPPRIEEPPRLPAQEDSVFKMLTESTLNPSVENAAWSVQEFHFQKDPPPDFPPDLKPIEPIPATSDLESIVARQLESWSQKFLPELAEKIIKEEILKLLDD